MYSLRISLLLAAFAVLLRPTNLLIWFSVGTVYLSRFVGRGRAPLDLYGLFILLRETIFCGSLALAVSLTSDRLYFGAWTFPPYRWLYFNISQSLAVLYGENAWHYFLSQGLPLLCTTYLPFVLIGFYKNSPATTAAKNSLTALRMAALNTIVAMSTISHKEVRFIYPLLPIFHVLGAPFAAAFFSRVTPPTTEKPTPKTTLVRKRTLAGMLFINLTMAGYLTFGHQAAPISVLSMLRTTYERIYPVVYYRPGTVPQIPAGANDLFVIFLMPCHTTPWRSHLIYSSLKARALTCEPPLHTAPNSPERAAYRDEAARFYDDPIGFLSREVWPAPLPTSGGNGTEAAATTALAVMPDYIAGFDNIEPWLKEFFDGPGAAYNVRLRRTWQCGNGLFNDDRRRMGKMVLWSTF